MAPKLFSLLSIFVIFLVCSICTAWDALYPGQRLTAGQSLVQGRYVLVMQTDCNLVLYAPGPTALWSSGTFGKGFGCFAIMQFDGNFVVYNSGNVALWASGTNIGRGNYILSLQPDRNLVIYGPSRWSTRTNIATAGFSQLAINATAKEEGGKNKP